MFEAQQGQIDIVRDGITSIIIPVMIPKSCRIEAQTIQIILETLMLLTLAHKDFNHDKPFPNISIVFNDFGPSNSDLNQTFDSSNKVVLQELIDTLIESLS